MRYRELCDSIKDHAVDSETIPVGKIYRLKNGATVCIAAGSVYATDRPGVPIDAINGPLESLNFVTIAAHLLQD